MSEQFKELNEKMNEQSARLLLLGAMAKGVALEPALNEMVLPEQKEMLEKIRAEYINLLTSTIETKSLEMQSTLEQLIELSGGDTVH